MTIYTIRSSPAFSIEQNGTIYEAGQDVDLSAEEFERHKHKLEGVDRTVELPTGGGSNNNSGSPVITVSLASLPEASWTPLPASGFAKDIDYKVFDSDNEEITPDLDSRRAGTSFEIWSGIALSNLSVEIEGEN